MSREEREVSEGVKVFLASSSSQPSREIRFGFQDAPSPSVRMVSLFS
jgi:hypothetical protein